jgi:membrane protease YdiL (CAAX protease family)
MKNKDLFTFLALTFGIGWLCMGLADIYGFESAGRLWLLSAMWSPLAGALLASRQTRRELWSRLKKPAWRYWPVALVVGWSLGIGQQVLVATLTLGHWNSDRFSLGANGGGIDSIHHVHAILGAGQQSFAFFAVNLVLSLILGSVITMLFATVGEEAGWRGVLQPEMQRRFGVIRGTLLVGLIWGYWHLPVNLAGLNDALHPMLGALLIFPLEAISMSLSFVLAWLMNRSGSILVSGSRT